MNLSFLSLIFLSSFLIILTRFQIVKGQEVSCLDDWIPFGEEKCIKLIQKFATFDEAELKCPEQNVGGQSITASLVRVKSIEEQQILQHYIFEKSLNDVWLGAKFIRKKNNFSWNDGSSVIYTNWALGEPSDDLKLNECFAITFDYMGKWKSVNCGLKNWFVCETTFMLNVRLQKELLETKKRFEDFMIEVNQIFDVQNKALANTMKQLDSTNKELEDLKENTKNVMNYFSVDSCGDWFAFKEEKCFMFFEEVGLRTFKDAQTICEQKGNNSSLISIGYEEEQNFISNLLFKRLYVLDDIWLGAEYVNGKYKWIYDKSDIIYSNWKIGGKLNRSDYCVEMNSDENSLGKWSDVLCTRKKLVVCQKKQTWTLYQIKNIFKAKTDELTKKLEEAEKELEILKKNTIHSTQTNELTKQLEDTKKELKILKGNTVPIGFIYVQFPNEKSPNEIWPLMIWKNITASYAGLFFRAEGAGSESFGKVQDENSPRLFAITSDTFDKGKVWVNNRSDFTPVDVNSNGVWSRYLLTGGEAVLNGRTRTIYTSVKVSSGEVRPRNMAIRVWERIG